MTAILQKGLEENPQLWLIYDELFYKRNKKMTAKIEEFLKKRGNYFVVVGAGHLVGRRGIIRLLEKKGHPVSQL
jgi:uncharacterized protein YbaP (TraB family)